MPTKATLLAACVGLSIMGGAAASRVDAAPFLTQNSTTLSKTAPSACPSLPRVRGLRNLNCSDATALIEQLKRAQLRLKAGERLTFRLLSGAPALDAMTKVSPREAFLQMPFETAFIVERVKTDNRLWRPYKLAIEPPGAGRFIWQVEVIRGFNGEFERVELFFGPPAPF